jgi:hypothetical protein
MYFANFPKIVYDFDLSDGADYRVVADITRNVRLRKAILENISLYDYYDIAEGETPEIISEKIYGTPYYHWVIMLVNQKYDYVNDFPLSQLEFDKRIDDMYGNKKYHVHHYMENGFIKEGVNILKLRESALSGGGIGEVIVGKVLQSSANGYRARIDEIVVQSDNNFITVSVSMREGKFEPNETLVIVGETTQVEVDQCTIPANYTTTSNYDYEYNLNESKRRIKIVDPQLIDQIIKEFKDII